MASYYYSGQGIVYEGSRDANGRPMGLRDVGNVSKLEISIEVTKYEHKESRSGSRAVDLAVIQEKKGKIAMTFEDCSLDNLAMAFWGTSTVSPASTGQNFTVLAYLGKRCPILGAGNVSSVVVKSHDGLTTYVLNTDYTVDLVHAVIIPKTGGAIQDGDLLSVTCNVGGITTLDAFTQSSMEKFLRFEGINTIDEIPVIVDIFRVSLDPLSGYGLLNTEIATFEVAGSMLYDDLQPGNSKFFREILLKN